MYVVESYTLKIRYLFEFWIIKLNNNLTKSYFTDIIFKYIKSIEDLLIN